MVRGGFVLFAHARGGVGWGGVVSYGATDAFDAVVCCGGFGFPC